MKASMRSRQEPRRVSNGVIIAAMLLSLCVLSIVKARYCSTPFVKPDDQLQEQMNSSIRMETDEPATKAAGGVEQEEEEEEEESSAAVGGAGEPAVSTTTTTTVPVSGNGGGGGGGKKKPTCRMTSKRSERCEARGDIRVEGNASTIYIAGIDKERKTKPYARYHDPVAMAVVREFTLKPVTDSSPECTKNHTVPAFMFSNGGFSGNLYHDYTDVLVPLFLSTHQFKREVRFLLSGLKPWWVNKFTPFFKQLTKYEIIDIDNDMDVHCFPRIVVGATFHKDMGIDPAKSPGHVSVVDFKRALRKAFGLERVAASRGGVTGNGKPRLLIISRKNSRRFLNEREMAQTAAAMGFDVRIAEPDQHTDMSTFAQLVNSADVMIGVHGAGLTNMVFLPRGAILIQVVPFGGLEWLTTVTFKNPAKDMEVTYMDYNVKLEESSLIDQYPRNHQVLTDPYAVHKQGWDALKTAYLDKQNIKMDMDRFKTTLQEALDKLPPV
uniref:Glycosyltransferase 61 catalytic domain-containing protein n=1 Tax=Leersia perrieri TaxID=77586 RepID=A0A0D9VBY5_9ORYZ